MSHYADVIRLDSLADILSYFTCPGPERINGETRINAVLPLDDFSKAQDGPLTDPKVFEAQKKKQQDELTHIPRSPEHR